MQQVDRLTSERYSVLGLTLMETAGMAAVAAIDKHYGPLPGKRVQIFCGKGNNGGDGAVIARHLWLRGAHAELYLFGTVTETRGDARVNYEAAQKLSTVEPRLAFYEVAGSEAVHTALARPADLYVDALFGTGAARPLSGIYQQLVELINARNVPICAVDIPSGLSADSGELIGTTVRAQLTVTMTAPKPANVLPPAMHYNGTLVVAPIGSPDLLLSECGAQLNLTEPAMIARFLDDSRRQPGAHKTAVGHVLVVAGGRGKTGAAALAAPAVLRAGAGLVTLATPASCQQGLATALAFEVMTAPVAETPTGMLAASALESIKQLADKKAVVALGPGIGTEDDTRRLVRAFLAERACPLVIDADGLNCLSPWPAELKGSNDLPLILTPHPGEMARLTGTGFDERARIDIARRFAVDNSVILLLKGERSVVAAPDGEVYINATGNAGMATAGSGDVLTGIIAGLLAQAPHQPLAATLAGVYLHGLAGDLAARRLGQRSLMASDITAELAAAIITVGGESEKRNVYH